MHLWAGRGQRVAGPRAVVALRDLTVPVTLQAAPCATFWRTGADSLCGRLLLSPSCYHPGSGLTGPAWCWHPGPLSLPAFLPCPATLLEHRKCVSFVTGVFVCVLFVFSHTVIQGEEEYFWSGFIYLRAGIVA